ncbi:MAG TPA: TetR/AcrR family transcriptional regulator C-terminal domain-containing protein [Ktedonobacterales bacterium]|nr:TetR/AcrR family transcriptional regulator C-terminal domain-containing protein [Ktedonobacterales bacterium]
MKPISAPVDLRVRRTHKLLWEALMAELATRPFEEITVTDICERAMVHRTTFYKHYADKYALLERGMRLMYDALVAEGEHIPPSAFSADDPPPYFVRLFEHVAEHQQFYRLMLCGEGVSQFQRWIKDYVAEVVGARAGRLTLATDHAAFPLAMYVQFLAGGFLSLVTWWLEQNLPLSPHQMAQFLLAQHARSASHV